MYILYFQYSRTHFHRGKRYKKSIKILTSTILSQEEVSSNQASMSHNIEAGKEEFSTESIALCVSLGIIKENVYVMRVAKDPVRAGSFALSLYRYI